MEKGFPHWPLCVFIVPHAYTFRVFIIIHQKKSATIVFAIIAHL